MQVAESLINVLFVPLERFVAGTAIILLQIILAVAQKNTKHDEPSHKI